MPDDQQQVINPTEPYRMPPPEATEAWRSGVNVPENQRALAPASPLAMGASAAKDVAAEQQGTQGAQSRLSTLEAQRPKPPQLGLEGPPPDARNFKKHSMEFAAAMAVLGGISSKFTRQPAGAALSAFAGAMNGWQQGNLEAYEQASAKWEQESRRTIANNRTVLEKYSLALADNTKNIDEQMATIQLIAAQYHDQMLYDAAAAKNFTMVGKLLDKGVDQTKRLENSVEWLAAQRQLNEAQTALLGEKVASGQVNPEAVDINGQPMFNQAQRNQMKYASERYLSGAISPGAKTTATQYNQQQAAARAPAIVDAIEAGTQPPTLTGMSRAQLDAVRAEASRRGLDLVQMGLQYQQAQAEVRALNTTRMMQYIGLSQSVVATIDRLKQTAAEMDQGGINFINRAELAKAIRFEGNSPRGQLAARYMADVNSVKEEFANLANGGYAPTDAAWKLANEQINGEYGVKELTASLDEVQRIINYRRAAIPNLTTLGPGNTTNPYFPAKPSQQGQTTTPPAATPTAGTGGGGIIKYDAEGNRVQ